VIFDTHCHLGYTAENPAETASRAMSAGVSRLLTVGVDLASSQRAQELARDNTSIFHAVGLHPNSAAKFQREWQGLQKLLEDPACVAIGETGLDYYRDHATPDEQKTSLRAHLKLAVELSMPVIIHTRDAFGDIFDELAAFPTAQGVLHCFSGGVEEARRALDLDYYLSFAGPLTYPGNEQLRDAAAFAPKERILVETDAPFLPPQKWRGQPNEPGYIVATVQQLATVRGIAFEEAAELTTANGRRLFRV
jgi:TatD DNase family protein